MNREETDPTAELVMGAVVLAAIVGLLLGAFLQEKGEEKKEN